MIRMFLLGALALSPQQTDTTFAVRAGGTVEIESWGGRVEIRTWDQNRMRVRADKPADTEVEIDIEGATVRIDVDGPHGMQPVSLQVTVPRRYGVQIDGVQTEVDVADVEGDVYVETMNGAVTVRNVTGRIEANSTQGLVSVADSRGDLMAETVNDGIRINNHEGEIDAETVNGPITLRAVRAARVAASTTNGAILYEGEIRDGGSYGFASHNGDLTLHVPAGANATFSIDTYTGQIDADFPIRLRGTRTQRSMTFEIGNGSARINLESFGGTVFLRSGPAGGR